MAEPIIRLEQKDFQKDLDALQNKQFPFAFAKTLTDVAKLGQGVARAQTRKVFRLHTEFIPNEIRITPARKADVKIGSAKAEVRTTEKIDFMTLQEEGGNKRPTKGSALAIPSFPIQRRVPDLRTGTGKVKAKYLPSRLLQGPRSFVRKAYLWAFAKALSAIEPFFLFAGSAKIRPKWKFEKVIRKEVEEKIEGVFEKNLEAAMNKANP